MPTTNPHLEQRKTVFSCEICQGEFTSIKSLIDHKSTHHVNMTLITENTATVTHSKRAEIDPDYDYSENEPEVFFCHKCDYMSQFETKLAKHLETEHPPEYKSRYFYSN